MNYWHQLPFFFSCYNVPPVQCIHALYMLKEVSKKKDDWRYPIPLRRVTHFLASSIQAL